MILTFLGAILLSRPEVYGWAHGSPPPSSPSEIDLIRRSTNNLAAVEMALGSLAEAESILLPLVAEAPGYADALTNLGTVYHRRSRATGEPRWLDAAVVYYRRALAVEPWHREARDNLAVAMEDGR